jgi:hypothetical protein
METAIAVVGRFHNLLLHFPIALALAVAFVQLALRGRIPEEKRAPVVNWLFGLLALATVGTVVSGLCHMSSEQFRGEELVNVTAHRNAGLTALVFVLAATVTQLKTMNRAALPLVALAAIFVSLAGHTGGKVVHGSDYFSQPFADASGGSGKTGDDDDAPAVASDGDEAEEKARDRHPEGKAIEKPDFVQHIKPLFERSCNKCHGAEKRKGGLRLDRKRFAMKGGETGDAIVPGDPDKSLVVKYINLPPDDEDVMPSKGKLMAQSEIDTIRNWVKNGAEWPDDPE